jgi:hypothetical protein
MSCQSLIALTFSLNAQAEKLSLNKGWKKTGGEQVTNTMMRALI